MEKSFKSKWNSKDETCPHCGQVTKFNRGLTKQNLGKLFQKPSIQDIMIFVMIVMLLFGAWAYQKDTERYKEAIRNPSELCTAYYEAISHGNFGNETYLDFNENGSIEIFSLRSDKINGEQN